MQLYSHVCVCGLCNLCGHFYVCNAICWILTFICEVVFYICIQPCVPILYVKCLTFVFHQCLCGVCSACWCGRMVVDSGWVFALYLYLHGICICCDNYISTLLPHTTYFRLRQNWLFQADEQSWWSLKEFETIHGSRSSICQCLSICKQAGRHQGYLWLMNFSVSATFAQTGISLQSWCRPRSKILFFVFKTICLLNN